MGASRRGRLVQTQAEKDLSTLDSLPRMSQKAVPTGKAPSLPTECDPLLSEAQIYEFPVGFYIFISLVAQKKIRIILAVELST